MTLPEKTDAGQVPLAHVEVQPHYQVARALVSFTSPSLRLQFRPNSWQCV
jgi:hypothetical protein